MFNNLCPKGGLIAKNVRKYTATLVNLQTKYEIKSFFYPRNILESKYYAL